MYLVCSLIIVSKSLWHPPGGARRLFVQSAILIIASAAAARLGLDDVTVVDCCPGQSGDAGLEAAVFAVISSGYSLLTGLLVDPVLVRMCASRTRPSPPLITSSTTASFYTLHLLSWSIAHWSQWFCGIREEKSGISVSICSRNVRGSGLVLLHVASCQRYFHSRDQMDHHQQWGKAVKWFFFHLRDEKVLGALHLYNHLIHRW